MNMCFGRVCWKLDDHCLLITRVNRNERTFLLQKLYTFSIWKASHRGWLNTALQLVKALNQNIKGYRIYIPRIFLQFITKPKRFVTSIHTIHSRIRNTMQSMRDNWAKRYRLENPLCTVEKIKWCVLNALLETFLSICTPSFCYT